MAYLVIKIEMDYQLIYQYTPTNRMLHIFPLLIFVLVATLLVLGIKKYHNKKSVFMQLTLFLCYSMLIISSIMAFITFIKIPDIISNERQLKNAIYDNNYSVVEGKIDNYSQQKINGRLYEKFEIDSVQFELSNNLHIEGFPEKSNIEADFKGNKEKIFRIKFARIKEDIQIIKIEKRIE